MYHPKTIGTSYITQSASTNLVSSSLQFQFSPSIQWTTSTLKYSRYCVSPRWILAFHQELWSYADLDISTSIPLGGAALGLDTRSPWQQHTHSLSGYGIVCLRITHGALVDWTCRIAWKFWRMTTDAQCLQQIENVCAIKGAHKYLYEEPVPASWWQNYRQAQSCHPSSFTIIWFYIFICNLLSSGFDSSADRCISRQFFARLSLG